MDLTHLALHGLPLVEAAPVLFRERGHVALLAIALRAHFPGALIGEGLFAAQLLAPLQELCPAIRGLFEAESALDPDLAQAVDLAAEGFHSLEDGGEIHAAGRRPRHDGRLLGLVRLETGAEGSHLSLDRLFPRGDLGHSPLEGAEFLARRRRLSRELTFLDLQGVEMTKHALRLTLPRFEILLAGETGGLLGVHGNLEHFLTAPQRFDLALDDVEPALVLLRLQREVAELLGELSKRPLPAEQRVVIRLPLVLPPASRERARRRQHLAPARNIGCREARASPQSLRHLEIGDDADVAEEMLDQLGAGAAHETIRPGDLRILAGCLPRARGNRLEGHEGGRSRALALEIGQRLARVLEAFHDHPLEAIAE